MKVSFVVDRAKAIIGGYNQCGDVELDIDIGALSPEDRVLIANNINNDGKIQYVRANGRLYYIVAAAPTAAGLIAAIHAAEAEAVAEAENTKKRQDEEIAEVSAKAEENLRNKTTVSKGKECGIELFGPDTGCWKGKSLIFASGRESEISAWHSPEWKQWEQEIESDNAIRLAEARQREAETKRQKEPEAAEAKQAAEAKRQAEPDALKRWRSKRIRSYQSAS